MPIFEFVCEKCGHFFEELVRSAGPVNSVTCPVCQSDQVKSNFRPSHPGATEAVLMQPTHPPLPPHPATPAVSEASSTVNRELTCNTKSTGI